MYAGTWSVAAGVPSPCGWQNRFGLSPQQLGRHRHYACAATYPCSPIRDTRKAVREGGYWSWPHLSQVPCHPWSPCCSSPRRGDWEVAYDIWLDDWNIEVMIWLYNHGRTLAGDPPALFISTGAHRYAWRDSSMSRCTTIFPNSTARTAMIHTGAADLVWSAAPMFSPARCVSRYRAGRGNLATPMAFQRLSRSPGDWLYTPRAARQFLG